MTNDRKHGYLYAKTDEGNFRLIGKMVEKDRGNSGDSTDEKGVREMSKEKIMNGIVGFCFTLGYAIGSVKVGFDKAVLGDSEDATEEKSEEGSCGWD